MLAQPAVMADVGRRLHAAGVRALVVGDPPGLPHVELLAADGGARAVEGALDRTPWRWRVGADGAWRHAGRRRYSFDGGFLVTLHRALPTAPLPPMAVRDLTSELWRDARPDADGLLRPRPEARLVALGVQTARGALRAPAQLDELRSCAQAVSHWDDMWALARATGVSGDLRDVLPERGGPRPARGARSAGWRAARLVRERGGSGSVAQAVLREPWRSATTRCRFDGLELLAGPGTFLPRAVSEELVRAALPRLEGATDVVVADVGTGCGAVALALAHRLPGAEVLGVDVDEGALAWGRRNARRLGTPRVRFAAGSLLDPVPQAWRGRVRAITANVPCVPGEAFEAQVDAPPIAYVGADADGLGLQRRLAEQARRVLRPGGWLLVQLVPDQWPAYRSALEALGYDELSAGGGPVAVVGAARWPGT